MLLTAEGVHVLQNVVQQHRHATGGYHMASRHLVLEQVSQQGKEAAGSSACSMRAWFATKQGMHWRLALEQGGQQDKEAADS